MGLDDFNLTVLRETLNVFKVKNTSKICLFVDVNEDVAVRISYLLDDALQRRRICVCKDQKGLWRDA